MSAAPPAARGASGAAPRAAAALKVAYYGDDFTGATDTLSTAARAGLRARLFLRVPTPDQRVRSGPLDVLGIAGAARSMSPPEMQAELAPVRAFFATLDAPLVHYKICSTFDSAPDVGNIGTAVEALRELAPNPLVAIVGGQPNLGRWCCFGNLYAAAGTGGEVHRIDRHPTMSRHPVTPMGEADLRRHLARQGLEVASIDYPAYASGIAALEQAIDAALAQRPDAVLFDVSSEPELATIGAALWRRACEARVLSVGASSVLRALVAHWAAAPRAHGASPHVTPAASAGATSVASPYATAAASSYATPAASPAQGPVFVLAGSLSPITARQVAIASDTYARMSIDAQRLAHDVDYAIASADEATRRLHGGAHVIAVTADERTEAPPRAVAEGSARLVREVLARGVARRIGIAGGDTSSHAVLASGAWALSHAAQLAEGVPLCRLHADDARIDGIEMMLKGGQMGPPDVLQRLVHGTATAT